MYVNKLDDYNKARFGCKVYKLAINAGFTCPNRDGKCGYGGCTFCSGEGSGEFASSGSDIAARLSEAKKLVASKVKNAEKVKYVAYLQSHTNTYGSVSRLREIYAKAIEGDDIISLSIATRPDCLPGEVLNLIGEINEIKPVTVELGLQTIHEQTALSINRGYALGVYDEALRELKARGISTLAHMIVGLPGESREMIWETAQYIGKSGVEGIKIHSLYILSDAPIAKEYLAGPFKILTMEEYIEILTGCLKRLPRNVVIHRFTGDPPKSKLIAPLWSADKKKVLNEINRRLIAEDVIQGSLLD